MCIHAILGCDPLEHDLDQQRDQGEILAPPEFCNPLEDSFHIAHAEPPAGIDVPFWGS